MSEVQSPPGNRISWARAGPRGSLPKSTTNFSFSAMPPVRKVEKAVVERDQQIGNQPGHGERPALRFDRRNLDHFFDFPLAIFFEPVPERAAERGANEPVLAVGGMMEADFQGDHSLR